MGYVEDIQRINDLARELLNHHMADSLTEAVEKARQMLNKTDVPGVGMGIPNPVLKKEEFKIEELKEAKQEQAFSQRINNDEWKQVLSKNNEYIVEQFRLMKSKLEEAFKEIETLKEKVKKMDPPLRQLMQEEKKQQHEQGQHTIAQPQQKQEAHPRQGNFQSSDVAIDKIFYFGNK